MEFTKKTKLNAKKKIMLLAGILILVSCLSFFALVKPFLADFEGYSAEMTIKKQDAENKSKQNMTTDELFKNIKNAEDQIQKINSIYVGANRELELVTKLEEIASKHNIEQEIGINKENEKNPEKFKKMILTIKTSGELKNLLAYLSDIETQGYYINIYMLDIAQTGSDIAADAILNYTAEVYVNNLN